MEVINVTDLSSNEMIELAGGGKTAEAMVGVAAMVVGIGTAPFGGALVALAGATLFFDAINS